MEKSLLKRAVNLLLILFISVGCFESNRDGSGDLEGEGSGIQGECFVEDLQECRAPFKRQLIPLSELGLTDCSVMCLNCNSSYCPISLPTKPPRVSSTRHLYQYLLETNQQPPTQEINQILIKIEGQSENFTSFQILHMSKNTTILSLSEFACSEVSLSFAWINGSKYSDFSPPIIICIRTGVPGPPSDITYNVSGVQDCSRSKTALLYIHWIRPNDSSLLSHYTLTLTPNSELNTTCGNALVIEMTLNKNANNTIVEAPENDTRSPIFGCSYNLTLTSYPGGHEETIEIKTEIPVPKMTRYCSGIYDPYTTKYNVTIYLSITPNDCFVITNVITFAVKLDAFVGLLGRISPVIDPNFNKITKGLKLDTNLPNLYEYTFTENNPRPPGQGYGIELVPHLHNTYNGWAGKLHKPSCLVYTPPFPPTTITSLHIHNFTFITKSRMANFTLLWDAPQFSNGDLTNYEIWVGTEELPPSSDGKDLGGTRLQHIAVNATSLEYNVTIHYIHRSFEMFYVQVRSSNNLCECYSNWSSAIEVKISDAIIISEEPHSTITRTTVIKSSSIIQRMTFSSTMLLSTLSPKSSNKGSLVAGISPELLWSLVGVTFALIVIIVLLIVTIILCCRYGGRLLKRDYAMSPILDLSEPGLPNLLDYVGYSKTLIRDDWEIDRNLLEIYENETLGSGCFGEVCKGSLQLNYVLKKRRLSHDYQLHQRKRSLTSENITVAIKKLKKTAEGKERADFLKEMETMMKVSSTESDLRRFVVNMLGCCRLEEPILLVVEFVKYGNLLSYLRAMIKKTRASKTLGVNGPIPYLEPLGTYSKLDPQSQIDEMGHLTEKHLLDFSRQIAAGMEFLASLDIVHRDLACRNILVGEGKQLKVSDFGLSRIVPQDEVYTLTNHGRLPLRWMALESIFQREFTSASDVWSYGVVLWEISTMGAFPYSTMQERELLKLLKKGYRLPKPENCSQEMFDVMNQCWHPDPRGRPKFADLHKLFDYFLTQHTQKQYPYIDMDSSVPYVFDHLTSKSFSDYRTQEEIINLDEEDGPGLLYATEGACSSGYGSTKELSPEESCLSELSHHSGNCLLESGCCLNVSVKITEQNFDDESDISYDQLRGGEHPFLIRVSCNDKQSHDADQYFDQLDMESDDIPDHLLPPLHQYDFYNDIWMKKLSTITEVSCEDYGDQMEDSAVSMTTESDRDTIETSL